MRASAPATSASSSSSRACSRTSPRWTTSRFRRCSAAPWRRMQAYARAHDLLARVGLADRADAYPGSMSGGEQRRAVVARALINSPRLLLADEPTSDLDEDTEADIIDLLEQLQRTESLRPGARHPQSRARQAGAAHLRDAARHARLWSATSHCMAERSRSSRAALSAAARRARDRFAAIAPPTAPAAARAPIRLGRRPAGRRADRSA